MLQNRNSNGSGSIGQGTHLVVLDSVYDLGLQAPPAGHAEDNEKPVYKRAFCFHTVDDDGRIQRISSIVADSMGEKSKFREIAKALRGRDFTTEEIRAKGVDEKSLIGRSCYAAVENKASGAKVRAVIRTFSPLPKNVAPIPAAPEDTVPQWVVDIRARRLDKPETEDAPVENDVDDGSNGDEDCAL